MWEIQKSESDLQRYFEIGFHYKSESVGLKEVLDEWSSGQVGVEEFIQRSLRVNKVYANSGYANFLDNC